MPGNLEAPRILPERAYGVKKKSAENPYPTTISGDRPAATKPGSRAPKAAKRTLDAGARERPTRQPWNRAPAPGRGLTSRAFQATRYDRSRAACLASATNPNCSATAST
jgi:hypothetical protein